jgi:hypothetical protein
VPLALTRLGLATREKPPALTVSGMAARLPWVWDGLCFAVPFNDPTQDSARDMVANAAPTAVAGLAWARDNRGNPAAALGNTSYLEYPNNPVHNRPSTAITMYARLRYHGTGADAESGLLAKRYSSSGPWVSWAIINAVDFDGAISGALTVGGTPYFWQSSFILPTSSYVTAVLRWQSGTNPTLRVLGERGQLLTSNTATDTLTGSLSYAANQPIRINANESETVNFNADYSQVLVWDRVLTNTELQALVSDPFGWYSPRQMTVGVSSPFPIFHSTTTQTVFRVVGYAMFATTGERDAMAAEVQAWVDAHPGGRVTASAHTVNVAGSPYALSAGQTTPDLMDEADPPTGPHPGFTWSYVVESKELRDSFGALGGGSAWAAALEGSQLGEVTT